MSDSCGQRDPRSDAGSMRDTVAPAGRRWLGPLTLGALGLGLTLVIVAAVSLRRRSVEVCAEPRPWKVDEESSVSADAFRPRRPLLAGHDRTLCRVVLAVGVLVLLTGAFLGAGGTFPRATVLVRVSAAGPQSVRISLGAFVLAIACSAVAWILVFAGLYFASWRVRVPGLVLVLIGVFFERHFPPQVFIFGTALGVAALACILVLGVLTVAVDFWAQRRAAKINIRTPGWICVMAIAVILLVAMAYIGQAITPGSFTLGSVPEIRLIYIIILVLIPIFLFNGMGSADRGGRFAVFLRFWLIRRSPLALTVVTTGVAAAGTAAAAYSLGLQIFASAFLAALAIALMGFALAMTRPYPRWSGSREALIANLAIFVFLLSAQIAFGALKVQDTSIFSTVLPWIAVAVVAGMLFLIWRHRRPDLFKLALLYMVTVGVWEALTSFESTSTVFVKTGHLLPRLGIAGVQALAGLATLCFVAVSVVRHHAAARQPSSEPFRKRQPILSNLGLLLVLNCSLLYVWGAANLDVIAAGIGTMLVVFQSVVTVLALWWLLSSGRMYNPPAALMPLRARVLGYLAYLMVTLLIVLQLDSLPRGVHVKLISAATIARVGTVGLGVPLVIVLFLLEWHQQRHRQEL
jgi:hypothetical protein